MVGQARLPAGVIRVISLNLCSSAIQDRLFILNGAPPRSCLDQHGKRLLAVPADKQICLATQRRKSHRQRHQWLLCGQCLGQRPGQ